MKKIRGGLYEYKDYQIEKLYQRAGWSTSWVDYNCWVWWDYTGSRSDVGYKTLHEVKREIDYLTSDRNQMNDANTEAIQ